MSSGPSPDVSTRPDAGMVAAGSNGLAAADPEHIDRDIAALVRAIAKLAKVIVAPALDPALWRDRTGISDACR